MGAGEGVRLEGFDGLVRSMEAHNYVPSGESVWEMGVNADVTTKANEDYSARTARPLTVVPHDTTFVFVILRRWPRNEDWARGKRNEAVWRDVRVLDADDLEAWLSLAPSAEAWLAPQLRLPTAGTTSIDRYWDEWAGVTTPILTPAVVTAGWNDNPEEKLRAFLDGPSGAIGVASESREISAAFLAGVLHSSDDEMGERLRARTVVIEDETAWRGVVDQRTPSLLVPLFGRLDRVAAAVRQGHHVLVPLGRRAGGMKSELTLHRQRWAALRAALTTMSLSEDRVDALEEPQDVGKLSTPGGACWPHTTRAWVRALRFLRRCLHAR